MRDIDKLIISCAVTGSIHVPTMSPHLPITPEEIADEAVAAAHAGASIVHIHVRDPDTGKPSQDVERFREVAADIADRCDAIVQPTTGGPPSMDIKDRIRVVPHLSPEMASCNMGSINFALHPLLDRYDEFEHEWEPEFLDHTRDLVFRNTFDDLMTILPIFDEHGTVPELECYDVGHLYNAKWLLSEGYLEPPVHVQFVTGVLGGIGTDPRNITHMVDVAEDLFDGEFSFSVIGAGKAQFPQATLSMRMGGHVRVGLEDNLFIRAGELAKSNADQVEKVVHFNEELTSRAIATPDETREFLGLKGKQTW